MSINQSSAIPKSRKYSSQYNTSVQLLHTSSQPLDGKTITDSCGMWSGCHCIEVKGYVDVKVMLIFMFMTSFHVEM